LLKNKKSILNFFKWNKKNKTSGEKSYNITEFLNYSSSSVNISTNTTLFYYKIISPVSTAIDYIADEFQSIRPLIYNPDSQKFESKNPLLDLLNYPNSDETRNEFLGSVARYYLITGNSFIIASGDINRSPVEIMSINPVFVNIEESVKDMFAQRYIYNSRNINVVFDRIEEQGRFRYVNEERGLEIWHIRDFSCDNTASRLWGTSRLNSIYLEIEQYFSSNKHNLSVLKQGVRSSGILMSEQSLTQDQQNNLKSQINADYAGDVNAGRIFLLEGAKFDFKELSKSLKDMDFKDLKKEIEKSIYNRLKIPLPFISTDNQKFNNMFEAKLGLYYNTIIPLTSKLFKELSLFLMPRFKIDFKNNTLAFNKLEIEVLRERELLNIERLKKINIMTINELRNLYGLDKISSGADVIYQPINIVPIGTIEKPNEIVKNLKLLELLKEIKYKNGDNVYKL